MLGSIVFFAVAPTTVAGWVPYLLTRWRVQPPILHPFTRAFGALVLVAGLAGLVECVGRFATKGLGTPAPVVPTERLVVSGLYRYVRNPMYVAVVSVIVGQGLLLGSGLLVAYAAVVWVAFHLFVLMYEEPTLRRQFGESYDAYRRTVPRWWPRVRRRG